VEPGQNTVTNPFSILERSITLSTWCVMSRISLKPFVLKEIVSEKIISLPLQLMMF
jgi:hypothetical protein